MPKRNAQYLKGDPMIDINREDQTECSSCKKFELEDGTYGMYYPRFPRIGKERRYISSSLCPECFQKAISDII